MPGVLRAALLCSAMMLVCSAVVHAQASPDTNNEQFERDDQEARDLFKLGKEAFDEGRFERALMYFKDAYALSHRAALLSNIGSALDRLRRDDEALEAYKSYLEQVPDAPNRAFVEERVRVIEAARPKTAPPSAAAPATPEENTPTAPAVAPTPEQTAQAAPASQPQPAPMTAAVSADTTSDSPSLTSRWWFWASIGAVAAAAVVVGVSASSSGGTRTESPALATSDTHVRAL